MKKSLIFAMAGLVLFAACSKNDTATPEPQPQKMTVTLGAPAMGTKTVLTPTGSGNIGFKQSWKEGDAVMFLYFHMAFAASIPSGSTGFPAVSLKKGQAYAPGSGPPSPVRTPWVSRMRCLGKLSPSPAAAGNRETGSFHNIAHTAAKPQLFLRDRPAC